jgi:hypothetical protein
MKRELILGLALAMCVAGCGRSEEKEAERQAEQTAQTAEQAAEEAAKGLEDMARALGALAGTGSDGEKPVDPVSFRELIALMPDVDGWDKRQPTGERMTSPFPFSMAEVVYTRGDAQIEVTMTDSGFNQLLLTPYAMFLRTGYERETTEGYEKSTQVNGQPGWEKWNTEGKYGELNALVGKRYLLQIEGNGVDDPRVLHEFASRIDMGRLAGLK